MQSAFDVDRTAPAGGPVVEKPAQLAGVEVRLEDAVGKLERGSGAFLACTLEVELEERIALEFAEDVGGMQRREALAAREGALPVRDEQRASPVANLRFGANGGP